MAEDFEGAGQRYLFLLRPVKDLSKNFETDISKELDDYCLSLGEITANEEFGIDNQHRFNFAEAAMLIQGSAFVFGRKVDYLHAQAMHFFETLQPQKSKTAKKIAEEDDEGFVGETEAAIDPCDLLDYGSLKPCNVESLYRVHAKSKYKGNPPKIKVMPMSLLPLAENEKSGAIIYSNGRCVEVVGKMDDFRMNCGFLNSRGVLLLHLGHEQIVDDFASDAFVRLWQPQLLSLNENAKPPTVQQEDIVLNLHNQPADSGRGSPEDGVAGSDHGHVSSVVEMSRRVTANTFNDITSARSNYFGPSTHLMEAVGAEKEGVELPAESDFGCCDDDFYVGEAHTLPLPPSSRNIRRLEPQASPWDVNESETIESEAERILLDPFELVHWRVKPVETIKSFTRSTAVAAKKEKEENESATFQKLTMQTNDYVQEHFYMRKKHKITKEDDWQTDALYRFMVAASKKRAEAKRERGRRKANPLLNYNGVQNDDGIFECDDEDDGDEFVDVDPVEIEDIPSKCGEVVANEKNEDSAQIPKKTSIEVLMFGDIDDDELNNSINVESLYGGCLSVGETRPVVEKRTEAHTFLEILHQRMLRFWSTTEEITSEVHARVQEWENAMLPILEEEETRKEFDIHEYGDELLNMFHEVGEVKTLDELLAGRKRYEVSRYFLACLMMANTQNVRIESDVRVDENGSPSSITKVTLLKMGRHHEVFDREGAL